MAIALGALVDDAIIVVENIMVRQRNLWVDWHECAGRWHS
jgi:multidrug efflux pump subunit AcrB